MPLVENSAGEFPEPGVDSVEAAAAAVSKIGPNNAISLADLPASAKGAYPISTYTYVIVPLESDKADELKKFITYAIGPGQAFGPDLDFAPLPKQVVAAGQDGDRKDRQLSSWRPAKPAPPDPVADRARRERSDSDPMTPATAERPAGARERTFSDRRPDPRAVAAPSGDASSASSTRSIHLAAPAISKFGLGFVTTNDWNPVTESFGAALVHLRDGRHLGDRAALRRAALGRDRALPDRARADAPAPPGGDPGRPAGGDSRASSSASGGSSSSGRSCATRSSRRCTASSASCPIFGGDPSALGLLTAAAILTIMTTPIITSVTREVFETVPGELKEGCLRPRRDPLGDGPPGGPALLASPASSGR